MPSLAVRAGRRQAGPTRLEALPEAQVGRASAEALPAAAALPEFDKSVAEAAASPVAAGRLYGRGWRCLELFGPSGHALIRRIPPDHLLYQLFVGRVFVDQGIFLPASSVNFQTGFPALLWRAGSGVDTGVGSL